MLSSSHFTPVLAISGFTKHAQAGASPVVAFEMVPLLVECAKDVLINNGLCTELRVEYLVSCFILANFSGQLLRHALKV